MDKNKQQVQTYRFKKKRIHFKEKEMMAPIMEQSAEAVNSMAEMKGEEMASLIESGVNVVLE